MERNKERLSGPEETGQDVRHKTRFERYMEAYGEAEREGKKHEYII